MPLDDKSPRPLDDLLDFLGSELLDMHNEKVSERGRRAAEKRYDSIRGEIMLYAAPSHARLPSKPLPGMYEAFTSVSMDMGVTPNQFAKGYEAMLEVFAPSTARAPTNAAPQEGVGSTAGPATNGEPAVAAPERRTWGTVPVPWEIVRFLLGEGPLAGTWYGERNPVYPHEPFWWRKYLRPDADAAASSTRAPLCYCLLDAAGKMYWDTESCIWDDVGSANDALENQQDAEPEAGWRVVPLYAAPVSATRETTIEECAKVADNRALLWEGHGGAKIASPYSHLTVEGECGVIASSIRALKSVASADGTAKEKP